MLRLRARKTHAIVTCLKACGGVAEIMDERRGDREEEMAVANDGEAVLMLPGAGVGGSGGY